MPAIAKKARLSVRNWHEYNESLVARGSITIWFSDEAPGKINSVTADGGYDQWKVYKAIERRGARPKIAPRRNAKIKRHANAAGPRLARDQAIRMIRRIGRTSSHCRLR